MKSPPGKTCASCSERYGVEVLFCPKDGTPLGSARGSITEPPEKDPYLGIELPGQIRIRHLVGVGSMGRVYSAFQGGIERDVAVKVLHRELCSNRELVARFHREAKVASRLVHPNVVQVLMTGAIPDDGGGRVGGELYLVMEYLDGISLMSALAAAGVAEGDALPLPRALHIAAQLCDAVGEAHAQGIVHRDLKPENVMLVRRSEDPDFVKVLDFGIARLDWAGSLATQAGLIFGTAKYMSPEGAEGRPVGPQADVYSLATMLFQCLSGRTPFEGESPVALLLHHVSAPPPELRSIPRASYVPGPIASVIMANLAKEPEKRAANARAFGRDLIQAARASGLDPDPIVSSTGYVFGAGPMVRLVSKERTKALDLSPELAEKIGGRAAVPAPPTSSPASPASHTVAGEPAMLPPASQRTLIDSDLVLPVSSSPGQTVVPSSPSSMRNPPASGQPALDWNDAGSGPASIPSHGTMQGAELPPNARRDEPSLLVKLVRVVAIAAAASLLAMGVVAGGHHLATLETGPETSVDGLLEETRACIQERAWDTPAERNVKDLTTRATQLAPDDPRVGEVKREAAERIVTDALGLKYAGDAANALRLAQLAVELSPGLVTAERLVRELQGPMLSDPDPEPTAEPEPASDSSATAPHASPKPGPHQRTGSPPSAPKSPPAAPSAPPATPPPVPTSKVPPGAAAARATGPVLPPSPPPLPSGHGPDSQGGPWL